MSISLKTLPRMRKSLFKNEMNLPKQLRREESTEKAKSHLTLKYMFYLKEDLDVNKDLVILNFIKKDKEIFSAKTSLSNLPEKYNYELYMINKYDENLNSSLSFISEFDLEDDENKLSESFNSCGNEDSDIEQIEIKKSSKISENKEIDDDNEEYNKKVEKEWNDIEEFLLSKKKSNKNL